MVLTTTQNRFGTFFFVILIFFLQADRHNPLQSWAYDEKNPALTFLKDKGSIKGALLDRLLLLHGQCFDHERWHYLQTYARNETTLFEDLGPQEALARLKSYNSKVISGKREMIEGLNHLGMMLSTPQTPIGLYSCRYDKDFGDASILIFNVCIHPQHRGQGLGRKLMNHALKHCRNLGPHQEIGLTIYRNSLNARRLYESLGFQEVSLPVDRKIDPWKIYGKVFMIIQNEKA